MRGDRIRNKEGKWLNTSVFRQEAIRFMETGFYTEAPLGTPDWLEYWTEQLRRCREGYEVDGYKITGHHYCYLNFAQILLVEYSEEEDSDESLATKKVSFPDFWDGDYNFFWSLEIARNGICSSLTQVPSTEKEKKNWNKLNKQLKKLEPDTKEYLEIKNKRDEISNNILDRLGLLVKPHLDYLNGGYHFIVGKEQPNSCIVKTPFGDKPIGDIKVNDIIYNSYGSMSKVINVFPQRLKDVYEVTLFDGRKTRCGLEHLWEIYGPIYRKNKRKLETLELKELLNRPLKVRDKYKCFIKISKPVEKLAKDYIIPPYTLGAFLGDGNMLRQTRLSGIDEEINDRVKLEVSKSFPDLELKIIRREKYWEYSFLTKNKEQFKYYRDKYNYPKIGANRINPLYKEFEKLGINCHGNNKFIPKEYKEGSIYQRLELVKGLMDTDGSITKGGNMSFSSNSKILVKDLQEVLYSLGIQSTFRKRKNGIYILYINSNENLFHLSRKKKRVKPDLKSRKYVPIIKIEKLDYQEESTCIFVDSEDHCYLTDEYIVTHNSRRKGYSYKNAVIVANIYNTIKDKLSLIGAYEKKFIDQTMDKTLEYLNFFNESTGFAKNRLINKKNFVKSGYIENINGVDVEKGYKSIIDATRTFKDNADAMRGVDAFFILLEEAGAFDNLALSYNAIVPSLTAGTKITGQICIIGTSGDLGKGTVDYADMFYNPLSYGLMPFLNTWDENAEGTVCGFFHPVTWNMEGFYDKQGNSDLENATKWELERRQKILDNASSSLLLQRHMQEFPLCPADAFSVASINTFPVTELRNQLNKVVANNLNHVKGTPVHLYYEDGVAKAKPDLKKELQPIYNYKPKMDDLSGCPIIYEYPVKNPPKGLYKIGYDPYRQDLSSGVSLGAIYVVKGVQEGSSTKNIIVAEYIGRPQEADDVNKIAQMLAEIYNAEIMHENEVTHVKNYFRRIKKLNLLAAQPDTVISSNIKGSKVARVYGCHMNEKLKDAGEKYLKDWLLEIQDYDEDGNPVRNLDKIYSIGLLEELIQYNRKNNFDRVSAMFMCMMQIQEETLGKVYESSNETNRTKEMISLLENFSRKR